MTTTVGLILMVAAGCGLFLIQGVVKYMPTRWLKFAVLGMLASGSISLGLRGARLSFGLAVSDQMLLALAALYSVSLIILFLCATGKLNGHRKDN